MRQERLEELKAENPQGFTAYNRTGELVEHIQGYFVGIAPLDNVENYTGLYVGGWHDRGQWFVDSVFYTPNKAEAISLGEKFNQIAIWDIENNKSIYLGEYTK